jgi:chorismate synthase
MIMNKNSFGNVLTMTSFGESHGKAMGVVLDGCPSGLEFDYNLLDSQLARRRPGDHGGLGQSLNSQRKESDQVQILSGVYENKTLGTPLAMIVENKDQRSSDYDTIKSQPRVGHADDVWKHKYGHWDHRGGGRASGRETVSRVMAGAVAEMIIKKLVPDFEIYAFVHQAGPFQLSEDELHSFLELGSRQECDRFIGRFPSKSNTKSFETTLSQCKNQGESLGGKALIVVKGLPKGIGQPVMHKLKSDLAMGVLSIGATNGLRLGNTEDNSWKGADFHGHSKNYGGIRGGLSTGEEILLEVDFKPTSTRNKTAKQGRHDPFIIPRAIPVLESMVSLVLADHLLWSRLDRLEI